MVANIQVYVVADSYRKLENQMDVGAITSLKPQAKSNLAPGYVSISR